MFLTAPEWLPQVRRGGKRQREAEETRDRLEEALNLIVKKQKLQKDSNFGSISITIAIRKASK